MESNLESNCYYEILGVDKKIETKGLKKAYKRLALKYHPDKAPVGEMDNYKEKFQKLNEAYQIINDPNERAWYDSHRNQILNPEMNNDNYTGFSFDIENYFSDDCYKTGKKEEYGINFYKVFEEVFMKIRIEEEMARENDDELFENRESYLKAPMFGNDESEFVDIEKFYEYWEYFKTSLNFSWVDPFDVREGENRRVKRLIQKENKKARKIARKKYFSLLRRLINFVKSKDKRYQDFLEERKKKFYLEKLKKEKQKILNEEKWQIKKKELLRMEMENYEKEKLERIKNGEKISEDESIEELEEFKTFECKICEKTFKSENQLKNHEKSKEHLKRKKKIMKEVMMEGEEQNMKDIIDEIDQINLEAKEKKKNKKKKKKKRKKLNTFNQEFITEDKDEKLITEKEKVIEDKEKDDENINQVVINEIQRKKDEKKRKRDLKKKKRKEKEKLKQISCELCDFIGESKTKLFKHLKEVHKYK